MTSFGFELLANLIEGNIETQFFIRYLGHKKEENAKINWFLMIASHFIIVSLVNSYTYLNNYAEWIIAIIWLIILLCLLKGSFWEKVFLVGINYVLLATISIILFAMFDRWITYDSSGYMTFGVIRIGLVLFAKISEFLLLEIVLYFRANESGQISNNIFAWLSCIVVMTLIANSYLRDIIYQEALANNITNEARFVSVALFIIDIIVYIMCMRLVKNSVDLFKERIKNIAFQNKISDMQHIKEVHTQTMKIRHDMKNELLNIRLMITEGKVKEAEKYLDEVLNIKLAKSDIVFTDNYLIDAIINRTIDKCKEANIVMETYIKSTVKQIDEMDIAIILSNLLDNAVEATQKSYNKYICLEMSMVKKYFCISVKNTFDGEVVEGNCGLQTIKEDKKYHGYGLLNVQDIVKKYDGEYEIKYEGMIFETFVTLYMGN